MQTEQHPERALDLAAAGSLPEAERVLLDEHLGQCAACRAQLAVALATRESSAPHPWDSQANRLVIEGALARLALPDRVGLFKRRQFWVPAAAASIALAGIASAALRLHDTQHASDDARRTASPARRAEPSVPPARVEPVRASESPDASLEVANGAATSPRTVAPADIAPEPNLPSAAELFQQASALRAKHQAGQAIAVFRRLQQAFPHSREAQLSYVLAGRLLLDAGQYASAVHQFDRYLASGGEAAEEALAGRALGLERLGQGEAEITTWHRLLKSYPHSVYAPQAESRLNALSERSSDRGTR